LFEPRPKLLNLPCLKSLLFPNCFLSSSLYKLHNLYSSTLFNIYSSHEKEQCTAHRPNTQSFICFTNKFYTSPHFYAHRPTTQSFICFTNKFYTSPHFYARLAPRFYPRHNENTIVFPTPPNMTLIIIKFSTNNYNQWWASILSSINYCIIVHIPRLDELR